MMSIELISFLILQTVTIVFLWLSVREVKTLFIKPEEFSPFGFSVMLVTFIILMVRLVPLIP